MRDQVLPAKPERTDLAVMDRTANSSFVDTEHTGQLSHLYVLSVLRDLPTHVYLPRMVCLCYGTYFRSTVPSSEDTMPRKPLPRSQLARMKRNFKRLVNVVFDGNLSAAARELGMPVSTVHQYYQQGPRQISASVASRVQKVTKASPEWLLGETADELPPEMTSWIALRGGEIQYPPVVEWRVRPIVEAIRARMSVEGKEGNPWEVFVGPLRAAVAAGLFPAELVPRAEIPPTRDYKRVTEENRRLYAPRACLMHTLCAFWEKALAKREFILSTLDGDEFLTVPTRRSIRAS